MKETIIDCEDGTQTISSERFNELYHSKYGSIQESERVFIEIGYKQAMEIQKDLQILEIGFGTGLNALLTFLENSNNNNIYYTALEKYPLDTTTVEKLNFNQHLKIKNESENIFLKLHTCMWNEWVVFGHFNLLKIEDDLLSIQFAKNQYDLVFFDAFAPEAQPEMWTIEIFSKIFEALKPNGILTTYCAKGIVKRNLKAVGFQVESLPGPIGKREITRATKPL